jgi:hypothetical protein
MHNFVLGCCGVVQITAPIAHLCKYEHIYSNGHGCICEYGQGCGSRLKCGHGHKYGHGRKCRHGQAQ